MQDPIPTEAQEQAALAQWLDARPHILWCHVANERKCSAREGARLKRLGVKGGVPDVLIFQNAATQRPGIAIEIKTRRPGAKATKMQCAWIEKLRLLGWLTAVCHGAQEAIRFLEAIGYR
jgi:hypothetical protein